MPAVLMEDDLAPCSLEAEEALIGAVLIAPACFPAVRRVVCAEDFYRERHRLIFAAMTRLHEENRSIDPVTVADDLERHGLAREAGGLARVDAFSASVPCAAHAAEYAAIIARHARGRVLLDAIYKAHNALLAGDQERAQSLLRDAL